MKLNKIKVSGFKSFVDPTALSFPDSVVGVVGPNGCGKSNIIDAVRWVMGEGSARNLRGDSMDDVIFNGSSSRKPVGKASVELVFDNSDHRLGGVHGGFDEISIRRTLSRDAVSEYFLNNSRCRRRDITDIFHGTGLGPRSYAIIEQGMVSRIVEAKPEELRAFVEETAGVSRYKERRRETESRIRHTRENLQRVDDIRNELAVTLRRLQRQSQAAMRHKKLKARERLLAAQLLAIRRRGCEQQLSEVNARLTQLESGLEEKQTALRTLEREIEEARRHQSGSQEGLNRAQAEVYRIGSEVAALEQRLEHARDTEARHQSGLRQVRADIARIDQQLQDDQARQEETGRHIEQRQPLLQEHREQLEQALAASQDGQTRWQGWQVRWDTFSRESEAPLRQREVQQTRIDNLDQRVGELQERLRRQQQEHEDATRHLTELDTAELHRSVAGHNSASESLEQALSEGRETLDARRNEIEELRRRLDDKRTELQEVSERLASRRELQKAEMGGDDEALAQWLGETGLDRMPRLATMIRVSDGWQRALERLLGDKLSALCVDSPKRVDALPQRPPDSALSLVHSRPQPQQPPENEAEPSLLMHYVSCPGVALDEWLDGVYVAQSTEQALQRCASLQRGQCVVTRDGVVAGRNWLSYPPSRERGTGVLERAQEIEELAAQRAIIENDSGDLKNGIEQARQQRKALEEEQAQRQRQLSQHASELADLHNLLGRREGEVRQLRDRLRIIRHDMDESRRRLETRGGEIESAHADLQQAHARHGDMEQRRQALSAEREQLESDLATIEQQVNGARDAVHQDQLGLQELRGISDSLARQCERAAGQLQDLRHRESELVAEYESGARPEEDEQRRLDELVLQRTQAESTLEEAKRELGQYEQRIGESQEQRLQQQQQLQDARDEVENERLARQQVVTIHDTLKEQAEDSGVDLPQVLAELPEEATVDGWQQQLETVERKIERIGPVNLVAIDEYDEQSQRKEQLDGQADDLNEALAILESAIREIDRETRSRFEDTFNRLDQGFREFFPRLFGGGSASLTLTGDDMLSAGVTVLARPPGKRNSTIHLLSGGEKALTAVALLFALFELNPAPFCMLDEVDAPLDDANVERYCETLQSLSGKTQLIFITHNKITMESADILIGVTMAEPGVSRLVAVNVEEALGMVAQQ